MWSGFSVRFFSKQGNGLTCACLSSVSLVELEDLISDLAKDFKVTAIENLLNRFPRGGVPESVAKVKVGSNGRF